MQEFNQVIPIYAIALQADCHIFDIYIGEGEFKPRHIWKYWEVPFELQNSWDIFDI